ncbi:MAG: MarR family winged helix-turn-helix transcriptional regulator [Actinomycetes bacterium]
MTGLPFDPITEARRHWEARGWADAAPAMAAVTSVMRAQQLLLARIDEVLRPLELTFARYELLMVLEFSRNGALPLGKLGERLQVHPTSVTSAVDRLEREGLVVREEHPTDRRAKLATITEAGRALAKEATARLNDTVFADPGLTADEQATVVDVLGRLRERAGDF